MKREKLFEAYCRNELNEISRSELRDILQNDSTAVSEMRDYLLFYCAMHDAVDQLKELEKNDRRGSSSSSRRLRIRSKPKVLRFRPFIMVAMLFLSCVFFIPILQDGQSGPVLRMDSHLIKVLRNGELLSVINGSHLQDGDQILAEDGPAEINFEDGSVLSLLSGKLELVSWRDQKKLRLYNGSMYGDIRPQGSLPLEIFSDNSRIVVLGTAFSYRSGQEWSDLSVDSGVVRFVPLDNRPYLDISAGKMARVANGIEWRVFNKHDIIESVIYPAQFKLENGTTWKIDQNRLKEEVLVDDAKTKIDVRQVKSSLAGAEVRVFAESGVDYIFCIEGYLNKPSGIQNRGDMILVDCKTAIWQQWDYEKAQDWSWLSEMDPSLAIFNGFASWSDDLGEKIWIAGPADPWSPDVVPKKLRLRFNETGIHVIRLLPTAESLTLSRVALREYSSLISGR